MRKPKPRKIFLFGILFILFGILGIILDTTNAWFLVVTGILMLFISLIARLRYKK